METNIWEILHVAGVFNEIILFFLLFFQKRNRRASRFLAVFLLIDAFNRMNYLFIAYWYVNVHWFTFSQLPTEMAFGFLIWLYILHVTDINYQLKVKHLWFGFPIFLDIIYCLGRGLYIYCYHLEDKMSYRYVPLEFLIHEGIAIVYNLSMLFLAYRYLLKQQSKAKTEYSNFEKISLTWLNGLMRLLVLMGIVWVGYYLTEIYLYPDYLLYQHYYPFWLIFLTAILVLGYRNLMQGEISFSSSDETSSPDSESYSTSSLDPLQIKELSDQLIEVIETKHLYRDAGLRLGDLAKASNISPHHISQIISQGLETNFHHLINRYRVLEVQQKLIDPAYDHFSILSIALDSGFNSKSTFNQIFKTLSGMSPSEYKKSKRVAPSSESTYDPPQAS